LAVASCETSGVVVATPQPCDYQQSCVICCQKSGSPAPAAEYHEIDLAPLGLTPPFHLVAP